MSLEQEHHKTRFHLSEENTFSIIFYFSLGDCISLQTTASWTVIRKGIWEGRIGTSYQCEVSTCISNESGATYFWEHGMLMKRAIIFLSWFLGLFPTNAWHTVNSLFSFMILRECIWQLGKSFSQEFSAIAYLLADCSSGHR